MITNMEEHDVSEAAQLIQAAYAPSPWNEQWTLENGVARIQQLLSTPNRIALKAGGDNQLTGFAIGVPHHNHRGKTIYLDELCVLPRAQRRGIGASLLKAMEARSRSGGFFGIWLVSQPYGEAASFYQSNNYVIGKRLAVYTKSL
jgi:aminoglycoside 6'-N-acetyltransferase I